MGYQKINIITGWVAFLIAMVVYALTVEPTASFWDCGEFIATAYKLEVPHPPGAPFFLLIGRLFSMLAGDDVTQVAYWVNMLSVTSGAFTILFLFWSITHLSRKILKAEEGEQDLGKTIAIMGAGLVGALACTFSDSVWFSAVEAEVYAMSSFFTAFVFWAILKWETIHEESDRNKWLILIAYMMGLSIGVHLLNLVTIPALGLIVYFNYSKQITRNGIIATMAVSGAIILLIMIGVIPGLASVVGTLEIFFVNGLGLPFGSGVIFFAIVFVSAIVFGVFYSIRKKNVILNTALLGFIMIMIGYSSYSIVLIRSNFDTPIDENNPEDIMTYVSYLKREQYGSRPLFKGQYYTAAIVEQTKGDPIYMKGEDEYEIKDYKVDYVYDPAQTTILPRMYSKSPAHEQRYRQVTGLKKGEKPSFVDNVYFMIRHQLGTMYFRYFMWNFSGRASDIQDAPWVGILGAFDKVPSEIADNKARNIYFGLPLLFGLIGLFYQYRKDAKYFWVTLLLFFLTGAALVLYLNSPPIEPRERDYIYAGSYYVFAIWIGMSVLALYELIAGLTKNQKISAVMATVICLAIPSLMASENWDDHDRSGRYFSIDAAKNYLDSCAPNSIIFTGGDNDTFPLWFAQEVLGYRTDVRVIVLSYFNTDWYIEQMMRDAYDSKALPFGLTLDHYQQGGPNDYLPFFEERAIKGAISAKGFLDLLYNEDKRLLVPTAVSNYNLLPSKDMFMNVNQSKVGELSWLFDKDSTLSPYITDRLIWSLKGSGLEKKDLAIIDLIVNTNWERPIYFNNTSLNAVNFNIKQHVIQEGLTYRLAPVQYNGADFLVNVEVMYDNLMNKFHWRGLDDPNAYYNEDYRSFCLNHRSAFNSLATALIDQGDNERALTVLNKSLEVMPDASIPYDVFSVYMISLFMELGETERATEISEKVAGRNVEWLEWAKETGEILRNPSEY
ncbi:MAG: hypothetical protein ACI9RP_002542, partial [Cyclobacteriaceae bacterium]